MKELPPAAAAGSAADWRELSDPPPENVKIWVQLKSGIQCYGVRRGNTIHVGVPDAFKPEVVLWTDDPDAGYTSAIATGSEIPKPCGRCHVRPKIYGSELAGYWVECVSRYCSKPITQTFPMKSDAVLEWNEECV